MTGGKLRALAITLIMVASVMVAGVTITGTAAANHGSDDPIVVDKSGQGDYQSIQAAVYHATSGETVEVRSGTYEEDVFINKSSITLTAPNGATIVGQSSGKGAVAILSSASVPGNSPSDVVISGFTVRQGQAGLALSVENGEPDSPNENLTIENNTFVAADGGLAVYAEQLKNSTFRDNTFRVPAEASAKEIVAVAGQRTYGSDFSSSNVDLINNTFIGNAARDSQAASAVEFEANDSEISGNNFSEATTDSGVVVHVFGDRVEVSGNSGYRVGGAVNLYNRIQPAVTRAGSGDTITVSPGTYHENITVANDTITLLGPNAGIHGTAARGLEAIIEGQIVLSGNQTTVDGFVVSPTVATSNPTGEALRVGQIADNVTVVNNVVRGFDGSDLPQGEGAGGIVAFGGRDHDAIENVTIADNNVTEINGRETGGGAAGISIQGNVDGALVENNVVSRIGERETAWAFGIVVRATGNHDVHPSNVTLDGNNISNLTSTPEDQTLYGVGIGVEARGGPLRITNNDLTDNEMQVEDKTTTVDLQNLILNNNLDKAVVAVNKTAEPDVPAADPYFNIWSTVQDGVNDAESGYTVNVKSGTYDGVTTKGSYDRTVELTTDNITLAGVGEPRPTLETSGTVRDGILIAGADNVTIHNFTVTGYRTGINLAYTDNLVEESISEPELNVENLTVSNVNVVDNDQHGILALRGPTHQDLVFENLNASENGHDAEGFFRGAYIKSQVDRVQILNSTFIDNDAGGVDFNHVRDADNVIAVVNTTTAGNGVGIAGHWVTGVEIHNNTIRDGIDLNGFQGAVVKDNNFTDISSPAVNLKWEFNALGVPEPSDIHFRRNTFEDVSGDAIVVGFHNDTPGDYLDVHESSFVNVTGFGVNNSQAGMTVNATHNYWGHPSGPRGPGADVEGNVTYKPYYIDEELTRLPTAANSSTVQNDRANVTVSENTSVSVELPPGSGASSVSVVESEEPTGDATDVNEERDEIYLEISADTDVTGDITVSVTKSVSTLENRGIDPNNAVLNHFNESANEWEELDTSREFDDGNVTLRANVTSLSPFAIAEPSAQDTGDGGTSAGIGGGDIDDSEEQMETQTATPAPTSTPTPAPTATPEPAPEGTPAPEATEAPPTTEEPVQEAGGFDLSTVVLIALGLMVLIAAMVIARRRRG